MPFFTRRSAAKIPPATRSAKRSRTDHPTTKASMASVQRIHSPPPGANLSTIASRSPRPTSRRTKMRAPRMRRNAVLVVIQVRVRSATNNATPSPRSERKRAKSGFRSSTGRGAATRGVALAIQRGGSGTR